MKLSNFLLKIALHYCKQEKICKITLYKDSKNNIRVSHSNNYEVIDSNTYLIDFLETESYIYKDLTAMSSILRQLPHMLDEKELYTLSINTENENPYSIFNNENLLIGKFMCVNDLFEEMDIIQSLSRDSFMELKKIISNEIKRRRVI
jgi:hypothetical protein